MLTLDIFYYYYYYKIDNGNAAKKHQDNFPGTK